MKKVFLALMLFASAVFAEPSFDQIEGLIAQHQYAAAEQGLEVILHNHPGSAKAFYAMAQAQAGLGHLDKAQLALNKAKGLDPYLKFASADNIEALQAAITPQVAKIQPVEESHFWRNLLIFLAAIGAAIIGFFIFREKDKPAAYVPTKPNVDSPSDRAYMKDHNLTDAPVYGNVTGGYTPRPTTYTTTPATYVPAPQPTVINNNYGSSNSGSGDLLTGVLVGEMLAGNHHSTTYVERDVIVERPVYQDTTPSYVPPASRIDDSWNDTPTKSSSWVDDSSSSTSSSWDDSSSSSSSSWSDSSSSSSDSGSSDW